MRNFQKLASGVDVTPLLHSVMRQPELWDQNTLRTTHELTPHKAISDIWLRFNKLPENIEQIIDEHESIFWPAWFALPEAASIIFDLMRRVNGVRLGRVLITRLPPGAVVEPHVDGGEHAAYYDRYHVTLQNGPGSTFRCGNEVVSMAPGEVWWFDNSVEHEVINNSHDDRLTMIVDIRTVR